MTWFSNIFRCVLLGVIMITALQVEGQFKHRKSVFRNSDTPVEIRISELLRQLTLEEKISLLGFRSPAIPRLGIPAYNWWNEGLHGVARAGQATVFPQAIAMAATFDDSLMLRVADAISTEARAKYNLAVAMDRRLQYMGLTFWSPNINIFRDPRWGRGQETYGEDPFLTAAMGTAFVKGMQGSDPLYLKTAACAKHFAAHSGPEAGRHAFDAVVDEKDLRETYLYAFKKLVDADVEAVMCAYNRLNGQPCCTSTTLLQKILRHEWKFKGHIVTDCWALEDIWRQHKVMNNSIAVAAAALKAGVNLDCSNMLQDDLKKAWDQKLVTTADIDAALTPILRTQVKLGFYDAKEKDPFSRLGENDVHNKEHIALAREAARQSMVLLKNEKKLLPLQRSGYRSIMVIGPNAGTIDPLLGNYHGISGNIVSFAEGIAAAAGPATAVQYDQGSNDTDTTHLGGIWGAGESDVIIAVIGLTPVVEGEEGDAFLAANGGDKLSLDLPAAHIKLLKELRKKNKPLIAVVTAGSAVNIAAIAPYADAIILAWYAGEQGGNALADIIFGDASPSGRLPVTFYHSLNDLPSYDDYAMKGRTYRYYKGDVQYPFGYGLSYSSFEYSWASVPKAVYTVGDTIHLAVEVMNTGNFDADEVVQVYVQYPSMERMPMKELKAFKRVSISKGEKRIVRLFIPISELEKWDMNSKGWKLLNAKYNVLVANASVDVRLESAFVINIPH